MRSQYHDLSSDDEFPALEQTVKRYEIFHSVLLLSYALYYYSLMDNYLNILINCTFNAFT